ncbi:RNA-binding protein 41-like [Ruditapes philippinarum]|uniref:RNA-binding protein 41-like n=1 Tax=Ruditapes philippinarum TaxID=129788 RepID=UPI00295BD220|nr:RNA-binding protein 41-like [Ruditapes philippinarum]
MPGGSVNGRPFRETVDSYSRTGIPCGNPRRYQSHDVVRMEAGVRSRSKVIDGPLESIETEGQRQLKSMLQKQLDTKVTLQQQLGQKREFSKGADYLASPDELSGTRNLSDFIAVGEVDKYIEEMKNLGLTHEEILYKLQMENDGSLLKKGRLSNPDFTAAKLAEINDKIAQKKQNLSKPDSFSNVKPLSRHEMDLENAIATASSQNKFLHKTLIKEKETSPNDPLNCIPEILEKFSSNAHLDTKKHRKMDKKSYKKECTLECCNPTFISNCQECSRRKLDNSQTESEACSSCDTSCDQCQMTCDHEIKIQICEEKPADYVSKCEEKSTENKPKLEKKIHQKSTSFTVKSKKNTGICKLNLPDNSSVLDNQHAEEKREIENVEAIPESAIRQYKLTAEEVKKLPRFETYSPGEPSHVLFVKNLPPKSQNKFWHPFLQFR